MPKDNTKKFEFKEEKGIDRLSGLLDKDTLDAKVLSVFNETS